MLKKLLDGLRSLLPGHANQDGPGLFDRRTPVRFSCEYEVECKLASQIFPGTITDISPSGLGLATEDPLETGSLLTLSYRPGGVPVGRQRLRCQVVWCEPRDGAGHRLGLRFADSGENLRMSWASRLLDELGFDERKVFRRKAMRARGPVPARLRDADEQIEFEATVLNIGVGGALVKGRSGIKPRTLARLGLGPYEDLELLDLLARVVSVRLDADSGAICYGLRFLTNTEPELELLGRYVLRLLREHRE